MQPLKILKGVFVLEVDDRPTGHLVGEELITNRTFKIPVGRPVDGPSLLRALLIGHLIANDVHAVAAQEPPGVPRLPLPEEPEVEVPDLLYPLHPDMRALLPIDELLEKRRFRVFRSLAGCVRHPFGHLQQTTPQRRAQGVDALQVSRRGRFGSRSEFLRPEGAQRGRVAGHIERLCADPGVKDVLRTAGPFAARSRFSGSRIQRKEVGSEGVFRIRDVYRAGWTGLETPELVKLGIEILVDSDWIREIQVDQPGKLGRPAAPKYRINPRVRA